MIEYPYEEGSAAGYSGTVSQRAVMPTLFFFITSFSVSAFAEHV